MNKNCLNCNKEFITDNICKIHCSDKCRNNFKSKRHRLKCGKRFDLKCKLCLKEFSSTRRSKYCSGTCGSKDTGLSRRKFLDIPSCLENASRKLDKTLGYVRIYVPMHSESNTWGYVYEHRVIAEKMIGRSLLKNEIVHHKNGKRWDNREENLEVMNKSDHAKMHGQREEDKNI